MDSKFECMSENELQEIDGGIGIGVAILIGCGIVLIIGAAVSFYNGYSEAAGK